MKLMERIKKAKENKKGFTLVELIVVLVILAILAAILLPTLTGYIDKANEKKAVSYTHLDVYKRQVWWDIMTRQDASAIPPQETGPLKTIKMPPMSSATAESSAITRAGMLWKA